MPLAGALTSRFGCRFVIAVSAVTIATTLPLLAALSALPFLVAALLVFGAGIGAIDVAMNIQAIIIERASERSMMSGFHGLFSLGGIAGAGGVAALLGIGAGTLTSALGVSACIVLAILIALPHLLPHGSRNDGPLFAIPRGIVLLLGIMCFVGFLAEGAVLDWSAVFLSSLQHLAASLAGLGYASFATTMTIGRLMGDRVVDRLGDRKVILFGGLIAAAGFAVATLVPYWQVALMGYALIGVGCSNIVPVLFSSVGRQTAMPENVAVPAITTLGYAGVLAGPAGIGFVAQVASLPVAFLAVAVMLAIVGLRGLFLR